MTATTPKSLVQRARAVDVEALTRRIGGVIFRRLRRHHRRRPAREHLETLLMRALMKDEELRYRMLRFVDVYPALRDERGVAAHLEEYLRAPGLSLGSGPTRLLAMLRAGARDRAPTRKLLAWASRTAIETMGHQFIAGDNPRTVAPRIRELEGEGYFFTLDLLGEFVASEQQAAAFQQRYLDMIEHLGELLGPPPAQRRDDTGPRVNLSIKLSSLTSHFDPADAKGTCAAVLGQLRPLFRASRRRGAFVNVDMEKYEYRDLTLEIVQRLLDEPEFRGFEHIGIVLQSYLIDAEQSLEQFLDWLRARRQPMTIRLVKGAYWDSEQVWAAQKGWPVPVLTDKRATDAQFERMTRRLLEEHALVRTAIASHNVRSIAHAMALCRALGVPRERVEWQMLFGMAGPIAEVLNDARLPLRIYVPCGELIPGMAYLVRRILENTSNDSFLRQRFAEHVDEAILLADPKAPRAQ